MMENLLARATAASGGAELNWACPLYMPFRENRRRYRKRLSRPMNLSGGARSKAGRPDATATTNVAAIPKHT